MLNYVTQSVRIISKSLDNVSRGQRLLKELAKSIVQWLPIRVRKNQGETLRILYHHRTLGDGAEGIHIREMVDAFRRLGHEVRIIALVEANGQWSNHGSNWSSFSRFLPAAMYELAEIAYNISGRRLVRRGIRDFHPDFVYDRYCAFSTAAVDAARQVNIPVMLEVNSPLALERAAYEKWRLRFPGLCQTFENRICSRVDHIFAVSTPLKEFLVSKSRLPASKVTILPNGANPDSFDTTMCGKSIRDGFGIAEQKTVFGFIGALRPWHGLDMLLRAFTRLVKDVHHVHLLIIGDGPLASDLGQLSEKIGLKRFVTFAGSVNHVDIPKYLAAMDVGVTARVTFYSSPMKILEYMAMGIPTVAPHTANVRDIVEHGQEALLFEPSNDEALFQALRQLALDHELTTKLGAAGRKKIETRLNWTWNARRVIEQVERFRVTRSSDVYP